MKILALYNLKGGVGKTATAVNLAYLSAQDGFRTLIWDLDPQGASSFYFRVRPRVRGGAKKLLRGKGRLRRAVRGTDFALLDLLPADFSYRNLDLRLLPFKRPTRRLGKLLKALEQSYDHVFLDCAPSISLVSENVFAAAQLVVIPTIPTTLSMRALQQIRDRVAEIDPPRPRLLPFFSMVDLRRSMHRQICDRENGHAEDFLRTQIPYSSVIERMGRQRAPLPSFAPNGAAATVYRRLWEEVRGNLAAAGGA